MRVAGTATLLVALLLAVAPVLGAAIDPARPTVYRFPNAPTEPVTQPGSVALMVQVRGVSDWVVVDSLVVVPPKGSLPVTCATLPSDAT